jgi:hypothetical protein
VLFDTHIEYLKKIILPVLPLKPNMDEPAQKNHKHIL